MSHLVEGAGNSGDGATGSSPSRSTRVRRNCPWTEAEHRLFLLGLEKYGRGSWRNIAAEFVTTRTATQVASHAQKYFLRDSAANQIRKRQRPSIHDIRSSSSVPSTQLEQEQLKCSLQRINKQSMELEMNAASDFHGGGGFGYASAPQSLQNAVDDPSQSAMFQAHYPLSHDQGTAHSQILAQNVLRGLLNSPFQLADLNPLAHGHSEGAAGAHPRAAHFATHALTAPAPGIPTSYPPPDVFGDVNELGASSKLSPRAYALAGRHPTSDPNPMGNFGGVPPGSIGVSGSPPVTASQSALLSQQLHATSEGAVGGPNGAQRVWSVADMATSLGLERLYRQDKHQAQNAPEAVYGAAPDRQHSHSSIAATLNTANALRVSCGMSPHVAPQAQQAVVQLTSQECPPSAAQRLSMGSEEPSNGAAFKSPQHLQVSAAPPRAGFGANGPRADACEVGTDGNGNGSDPFLQLLQGLKVAKVLQGGGEGEEPQYQDSHYRALVQLLAQRNAQMPPLHSLPGSGTGAAAAASSAPHHPTSAPNAALGAAAPRSVHDIFDARLHGNMGSHPQGTVAGLEDMHSLASLVAHSGGMHASPIGGAQNGYSGPPTGMGGAVKAEPRHNSAAAERVSDSIMTDSLPMQMSAAPPPAFNRGSGGTSWDVGKMQEMAPQFHEALSRLHASTSNSGGIAWPNASDPPHSSSHL